VRTFSVSTFRKSSPKVITPRPSTCLGHLGRAEKVAAKSTNRTAETAAKSQFPSAGPTPVRAENAITGVVKREGIYDELAKIPVPTLVLVGDEDVATPPSMAKRICKAIPGSRLVQIPQAGHSSTVENPRAVNAALDTFLEGLRPR